MIGHETPTKTYSEKAATPRNRCIGFQSDNISSTGEGQIIVP